jgi:hypothetical protein
MQRWPSFTASQLNGFDLLAVEGLNKSVTQAANDATIGIANFQGNGDVTVKPNEYSAGTATSTVMMGTYTVAIPTTGTSTYLYTFFHQTELKRAGARNRIGPFLFVDYRFLSNSGFDGAKIIAKNPSV